MWKIVFCSSGQGPICCLTITVLQHSQMEVNYFKGDSGYTYMVTLRHLTCSCWSAGHRSTNEYVHVLSLSICKVKHLLQILIFPCQTLQKFVKYLKLHSVFISTNMPKQSNNPSMLGRFFPVEFKYFQALGSSQTVSRYYKNILGHFQKLWLKVMVWSRTDPHHWSTAYSGFQTAGLQDRSTSLPQCWRSRIQKLFLPCRIWWPLLSC